MKRTIFLTMIFFVFFASCSTNKDQLVGPEEQESMKIEPATLTPETIAILADARKQVPIDVSRGIGVGVLDRERKSTECLVAYHNEAVFDVYRFALKSEIWTLGELTEHYDLGAQGTSLGKTFAYVSKIAELFDEGPLRDTWYVPGNQTTTGTWTYEEEYVTDKPDFCKFYEGTDVNNGKEWDISFTKWDWWIYGPDPDETQSSTSLNVNCDIYYNGSWYPADKVKATYVLTVTNVTGPSDPTLSSPSDNAATNSGLTFSWNASTGTQPITYQIQVDDNSNFSSPYADHSNISATSKFISGLSLGTTYYWRVRASNIVETSDWSSSRSIRVKPGTPSVTYSVQGGNPKMTWSSVSGASTYEIHRKVEGTSWENWATTSSTSYTDSITDVLKFWGTQYTEFNPPSGDWVAYKVRAKSSTGALGSFSGWGYFEPDGEIFE